MNDKVALYVIGMPGNVGGAATKIRDMLPILKEDFHVTVVALEEQFLHYKSICEYCRLLEIPIIAINELPRSKSHSVAWVVCEPEFFRLGYASHIAELGYKIVFANCMMWEFDGEADAARNGLIHRVIFNSRYQASAFAHIYHNTDCRIIGNYVNPKHFPYVERHYEKNIIGRLSRADPAKYPENFPVFYEHLDIKNVSYKVMAWSDELKEKYKWHKFGKNWHLLAPREQKPGEFLGSLHLFVYPLGHTFKESWGRVVVEAMLTGCIPLVPDEHCFEEFIVHGENGFICKDFQEFKTNAQMVFADTKKMNSLSREIAVRTREQFCNIELHRKIWKEVFTFDN